MGTYNETTGLYEEADMRALVGRTIVAIRVEKGEQRLCFDTDAGPVACAVSGDCCSESWFAEIDGVRALLGSRALSAEAIAMPDPGHDDGHSRQECDQFYGHKITTAGGVARVVFRNSSNGYYGGELMTPVLGLYDGDGEWVAVTDDWTAYAKEAAR